MAKAKPKTDPQAAAEEFAIQALNAAIANPMNALFAGSTAKVKTAAEVAIQRGWVTLSEQIVGKKKVKSYRATQAGIEYALQHGEPVQLLKSMKDTVTESGAALAEIESRICALHSQLQSQTVVLERLVQKLVPPNLAGILQQPQAQPANQASSLNMLTTDSDSLGREILRSLQEFKKHANVGQFCNLKELYESTAGKLGATVGAFHECLRELDRQHKIRLVPWGSPMHHLNDEIYAMILGKEVKFYAYLEG